MMKIAVRLTFAHLERNTLSGIVFKFKSPSCGMMSAKLYIESGFVISKADGLFAYDRFERFKEGAQMKDLVQFHQHEKFLLQSKDEKLYRQIGNIVANREQKELSEVLKLYEELYKTIIVKKSSIGKTRNVLEHMAGFIKKVASKEERTLLQEQIDDYSKKIIPLIVPLSTLQLYAKKYSIEYILHQTFLNPYSKEPGLRSDIRSVK